ncbi:DUF3450 domain-containing protein [Alteromonas sp. ASW11-130]|uniref:DUF3450 domain-containing protein n=1 Tax=Alteromonas sp. ASW11-130 TaxID=3015775 RepID=UPI002241BBA6|nr:DUF3450 domain-containing protein [Alteromonas sp. ASW11-130]MCW8092884.1 DUF3450 domain-containing protein [Alteromonas sp. ASW11-130]
MSKRTLIASALMGAFALAGSAAVSANSLDALQQEEAKIHAAAAKSQEKINSLFEQSQELLIEYRGTVDQTENLKVYNDYIASLVEDQQRSIESLQRQIDSIEETKQGIVPLMVRMIDSLERFISLDIPVHLAERQARIERLRDVLANSNVTISEQFRQVIEAYLVEVEYGTKIDSYQGAIEVDGKQVTVDFFNLGRTALVALTLDQSKAYVWNKEARAWEGLSDDYLDSVIEAVKIANNAAPADIIKLPISAAE